MVRSVVPRISPAVVRISQTESKTKCEARRTTESESPAEPGSAKPAIEAGSAESATGEAGSATGEPGSAEPAAREAGSAAREAGSAAEPTTTTATAEPAATTTGSPAPRETSR